MSYQVLARKWRPARFSEMVGQEHVLQALINALNSQRLHHAYLFSGTRGVGKTTIARILAKCLNCEKGISAEPCGVCSACTEISEGRFVDLIEVDAASRTKVDDTRELLDNVQYTPTRARFKIYLIDEVHMLSNQSFNALLKTLEEPPEHVKFLLATTDPQKLPVTVLSRCLQFNLKHLETSLIHKHLAHILQLENVQADEQGIWQLAHAADGSIRDALSLTDQAIAFGNGQIRGDAITAMFGSIAPDAVYQLLLTLAEQDGKALLKTIQQLAENNPDYNEALDAILNLLHQIAVYQAVPEALDPDNPDQQKIITLAGKFTAEDVQLFYQIGINSKADFNFAPSLKGAFEMTLLRMLAFQPQAVSGVTVTHTTGRPEITEKKPEPTRPASAPLNQTKEQQNQETRPEDTASTATNTPIKKCAGATASKITTPAAKETGSTAEPSSINCSLPDTNEDWIDFFHQLPLSGMTRNIAANCTYLKSGGDHLSLTLDESQSALLNESHSQRIA
ncbi:MAG: DNA polymerase III subunit gamma/tau, partial [Pseudomonadales bacterium]|nr:DNA polymerase III subunit gamma/tau [Pseudomonadales bacterium]